MRPRSGEAPLPRVMTTPLRVQVNSPPRLDTSSRFHGADRPSRRAGGRGVPPPVEPGPGERIDPADLVVGELELEAPGPDLEVAPDVLQQPAVAPEVGVGL